MITRIEVSKSDIEILENELEGSEAISLSPLFIKFNKCQELIMLERGYAINLALMFHLNTGSNIPTYLEVDVAEESIVSLHE